MAEMLRRPGRSASKSIVAATRSWLPRGDALPVEVWQRRHRGITLFAWAHLPILVLVPLLHHHSWSEALVNATAAGGLAALGSVRSLPREVLASAVTLSLLTSTALLIHTFHGLIEIHFHFFVVIAVIAMYQQWTPYLIGLAYVLVHHAVMGVMMPTAVYNHPTAIAHPVLFAAIHGGFVLAESMACLAYWQLNERALDGEREQRRQAENSNAALARANQELSDLMAMMAHDLRAPVTVINGTVEVVLDSWNDLDDDAKRGLTFRVGSAGTSLEQMLEETLTLAALDGEGLQGHPTAIDLETFVPDLVDSAFPADLVEVDLPALRDLTVHTDRQHLTQILTNVLGNATKYGEPPLRITARPGTGTASLLVSDAGPGVPAAFVPRLFERYTRADEARAGGQRGTGLGLYIVKTLAEANGGSIAYRDAAPHGAQFEIRLPATPAAVGSTTAQSPVTDLSPTTATA